MQFCVFLGQVSLSMDEISEYRVVSHTCGSEQDFYMFYNCYAKENGFSIRKSNRRHKLDRNEVIRRRYCCSQEGYIQSVWFKRDQTQREPHALTRCGWLGLPIRAPIWATFRFDCLDRSS
jgi:hypothetical protein